VYLLDTQGAVCLYDLGMTKLLEEAFAKATELAEPEQDA
jgi:hypothetical protein